MLRDCGYGGTGTSAPTAPGPTVPASPIVDGEWDEVKSDDGDEGPPEPPDPEEYPEGNPDEDPRPVIKLVDGRLDEIVSAIEDVLIESGEPMVFQRDRALVEIIYLPRASETDGIRRAAGSPMISDFGEIRLRARIAEAARCIKYDKRSNEWGRKDVPTAYAGALLKNAGYWRFPSLRAVIETPTLRADGSILQTRGYDQKTCLYYAPTDKFGPVPEWPSRDDALAALERR